MLYVPSMSAAAASFGEARRPLIISIVASGTGLGELDIPLLFSSVITDSLSGGVIFPIVFRQLEPRIGFPWAVRVMAFIALLSAILSFVVLPFKPRQNLSIRRLIDPAAFKDAPFICFVLPGFFSAIGYYIPLLYLPSFTETAIQGFDDADLAFYLIAIVNGSSIVGRILAGLVAGRLGPLPVATLSLGCCMILLFSWIRVSDTAGLIVWSVVWGVISGIIVWAPGAIIPLLSPSLDVIGTRLGMHWAAIGLGVLIGSPIAGALLSYSSSQVVWWHLQTFSGLAMAVGAGLTMYPWIYVARPKIQGGTEVRLLPRNDHSTNGVDSVEG